MGLAATQARYIMLTRYVSDLSFIMQMITQQRLFLAQQSSFIAQQFSALNGDMTEEMEQQKGAITEALHLEDTQLEMQLKTYETQYKAASTELESVQKMRDESIKTGFKYA